MSKKTAVEPVSKTADEPVTAVAEEEAPNKHRHMVVLPTTSKEHLFEMADVHNSNPSAIVHMSLEWFYRYGPFREMYARRYADDVGVEIARTNGPG